MQKILVCALCRGAACGEWKIENGKWKVKSFQVCHSEERSDVGISGRQLRFRRWLSHDPAGYCEIATSAYGLLAMTSREASSVLSTACTNRQFIAGRGQPGPYNKCMRSAMACATCECLPEIAPQGHFLALRAQGATGAKRPRNDKFLAHFAK